MNFRYNLLLIRVTVVISSVWSLPSGHRPLRSPLAFGQVAFALDGTGFTRRSRGNLTLLPPLLDRQTPSEESGPLFLGVQNQGPQPVGSIGNQLKRNDNLEHGTTIGNGIPKPLSPNLGSSIVFPDDSPTSNNSPVPADPNFDSNCEIKNGMIYANGSCLRLLSDLACLSGQWLVLNENGIPQCQDRPCPLGKLLYKDRCVRLDDSSVCGFGEILYVEFTGTVYCDCEPNFGYDRNSRRCEAEHSQGSCPLGKILEFKGNKFTCIQNFCPANNMVYNPEDRRCYTKDYEGACKAEKNLSIKFNKSDYTVSCTFTSVRNIFEVPALTSCPPGSKRNYIGQCQQVIRFGFSSPEAFRVPAQHTSRYSVCPTFYVRYPNGACRKVNSLFSSDDA